MQDDQNGQNKTGSLERVIAFDVGATKTAWILADAAGRALEEGRYPTPQDRSAFLDRLARTLQDHPAAAVGIGIAGTVTADHAGTVICPNLPALSGLNLRDCIQERIDIPVTVDNDGRCALIGEVWQGAAQDTSSAVMLTLGTGVGGAVMQKGRVLPHPADLSQEISRLVVDPEDLLPAASGRGSVEALIGGRNLEERFGVPLEELKRQARAGDPEATEVFETVSYFFIQCLRTINLTYRPKLVIVGGHGAADLDLYLQDEPPCPVVPAALGEKAGTYGALRLALDAYEQERAVAAEWE